MAPLEQKVSELMKRVDELNEAKISPRTPDSDGSSRFFGIVEALIANQQATQANQQKLQDALISSHRVLQESLAAHQQSNQRSSSCSINCSIL
jgi:hypothetical protein